MSSWLVSFFFFILVVDTPAILYYLPPFFTCPPPSEKHLITLSAYLPPPKVQELFLHLLTSATYPRGNCGSGPIRAIFSEKSNRYEVDIDFPNPILNCRFRYFNSSHTNALEI